MRREKSLDIGRSICERRFASAGKSLGSMLSSGRLQKPLAKLGFADPDDFFRKVGLGAVSATSLQELVDPGSGIGPEKMDRIEKILDKVADPEGRRVALVGNERAMTRFSDCCLPVPGEPIVGHAARGSGVVVHSAGCEMRPEDPGGETVVPVEWRKGLEGKTATGLSVECGDRRDMLAAISETVSSRGAETVRSRTAGLEEGRRHDFILKVRDLPHLEEIMDSLSVLEGVVSVRRRGRIVE